MIFKSHAKAPSIFITMCRKGSIDRVKKLILLHAVQGLESRGKHTTKGPGKSWKPPEMLCTNRECYELNSPTSTLVLPTFLLNTRVTTMAQGVGNRK